jgi:GTP-binding protein
MKFLTSAAEYAQCPQDQIPEVIVMGRSNAGKSSFINALAGKPVAKVSQQPGKTRLLNFFECGEHYRWVDSPGYGYAAVGGKEQKKWQSLIEGFIQSRSNLVGGILVMDVRRKWTQDEQLLADYFRDIELPLAVILNKSDKVGQKDKSLKKREMKTVEAVNLTFLTSASKRKGVNEAEKAIFDQWIRPILS